MFSVTNSGSSNRLDSGDQQNSTASITPTSAPSAEAAEDFRRRDREVGKPGIFRRSQRRDRRERRGQDEFRHMEGVDQNLPQHDHGEMHDQDDRKRSGRTHPVTGHSVDLPFAALAACRTPIRPIYREPDELSTIWLINPSRPQRLHHQIDHVLAAGRLRGRAAQIACRRSPTGSACWRRRNSSGPAIEI